MIHILTTGGTIAGLDYENNQNLNKENSVQIDSFFETANVAFEYVMEEVFSKDSRLIKDEDRELLAQVVQNSPYDKILITHGTFSMQETAEYLGNLKINKTIVLVGSFILGFDKRTDASFNLGFAISSLLYLTQGVFIAMNGKVFEWYDVYKNLDENKFQTLKG
ncbi:asparaginase domain-containing protein [Aquimarina intermedia]|uniref:L-asparaginase n=1 Tax=Aquimarina intermedia TaxID=350814 RepID=A0A5S5C2M5_9FLAO|nr:asparaginase domain-containing protein [Aquimarina intermedia]TYP73564.1 L-asparaginase [Aquimarina intermedia]